MQKSFHLGKGKSPEVFPEWEFLSEVRKCPYTGKQYDAVRKVKCKCDCHDNKKGVMMIHFMPCCDENGCVEEYRYI